MFEKGELVIYETAGVCKVTDIRTVDMRGIDKNKMIRTLYRKNGELKVRGKKLPAMDSHYLKMAKGCLVTEISLALGMDESKVEEEIAVTVHQAE